MNAPSSLSDRYVDFVSDPETDINALCSVIRLISSVYLNKNKLAFPPKTSRDTTITD